MANGNPENGKAGSGKPKDRTGEQGYVLLRSERRKNLRKQLLILKVKGEDGTGTFFGYAKTVGGGGMFIASVNPKKTGEEFDLTFKLIDIGLTVRCRCKVVWVKEYDPKLRNEPGMGLKFIGMDDETRGKLEEWIRTR